MTNNRDNFGEEESISVSTLRLRSLWQLKEKYHPVLLDIQAGKYDSRAADKNMDLIIKYYIPNILADFPGMLNKIDSLQREVERLESINVQLVKQRDKAYKWNQSGKKLNSNDWKINQYFDSAEHLEDDPE